MAVSGPIPSAIYEIAGHQLRAFQNDGKFITAQCLTCKKYGSWSIDVYGTPSMDAASCRDNPRYNKWWKRSRLMFPDLGQGGEPYRSASVRFYNPGHPVIYEDEFAVWDDEEGEEDDEDEDEDD